MYRYLIIYILIVGLLSCGENKSSEFEIPDDKILADHNLISPYFIEQLGQSPIKQIPAWNDSLLQYLQITELAIENLSTTNKDEILEQMNYSFRRTGVLYCFSSINNNSFPAQKSKINYHFESSNKTTTIKAANFEGKMDDYLMLNRKDHICYIRKKENGNNDSLFLFGSIVQPKVILQKSGDYILSVDFVLKDDQELSQINSLCNTYSIDFTSIKNADLSVIYTNRKNFPTSSYRISPEGIQKEQLAQWEFNNDQLLSYSRYVNGNLVKDYTFQYGDNKLMKSFIFNQIEYSISYY